MGKWIALHQPGGRNRCVYALAHEIETISVLVGLSVCLLMCHERWRRSSEMDRIFLSMLNLEQDEQRGFDQRD